MLHPKWEKNTIWGHFKRTAGRWPEQVLITSNGQRSRSYREVETASARLAAGLQAAGIRAGDHISVQLQNSAEMVETMLALAAVGAVAVLINFGLSEQEFLYVLRQSDSVALITEVDHALPEDLEQLRLVVTMPGTVCVSSASAVTWDALSQSTCTLTEWVEADALSNIIYTSGSSQAPKGVLLTHDMLMRSAYANCLNRGFEPGRKIFTPLPLFHVYGYVEGLLAAVLTGGTLYLWNGKFTAPEVLAYMAEQKIQDLLCVPAQIMSMLRELEEHPRTFPELRAVYCSASLCPDWVWPAIRERLGAAEVITGYGQTEVYGASVQTRPTDPDEILNTRVGRLLPGGSAGFPEFGGHLLEYRAVDQETGCPCPAGTVGELWCRGGAVTPGYYNRPEINHAVFTQDGWFKTGDCGWFDEDGYLRLSGRADDMYKTNGENVSPAFLENTISSCPGVCAVSVLGIADGKRGQVGVAFLQLKSDTLQSRATVEQFCRTHLAKFQMPQYFFYMSEADWPRTSTGKVQKYRLREMAAERAAGIQTRR